MKLPLYKDSIQSFKKFKSGSNINLGLYYDKFCSSWEEGYEKLDKKKFINEIEDKVKNLNKNILEEYIERICSLTRMLDGVFKIYELTERFITGIGIDHPVEVGFLRNHTLGVPYIAGSSIKGIVKDWATNWCQEKKEDIIRIFGSDDDKEKQTVSSLSGALSSNTDANDNKNKVGTVVFFDALPYGMINIATDIITPHYSSYYSKGECPGDWSIPTPLPFLTIDEKQKFIFFIAPRKAKYVGDCLKATEWLEAALTTLGAGAKTATGYGRFVPSREAEKVYHKEINMKIE